MIKLHKKKSGEMQFSIQIIKGSGFQTDEVHILFIRRLRVRVGLDACMCSNIYIKVHLSDYKRETAFIEDMKGNIWITYVKRISLDLFAHSTDDIVL